MRAGPLCGPPEGKDDHQPSPDDGEDREDRHQRESGDERVCDQNEPEDDAHDAENSRPQARARKSGSELNHN